MKIILNFLANLIAGLLALSSFYRLQGNYGNANIDKQNSREIFNRAIALPMYYALTEDDIDYVCNSLEKCLEDNYGN